MVEVHEEENVADAVDWVQQGVVNPPKSQGSCGSCWAFSAMAALESGYAIASGNLLVLAEQQLIDCDKNDGACNGGWPSSAYDNYLKGVGICSQDSYPIPQPDYVPQD